MARQMTKKFKKFELDNAPIIEENERILANGNSGSQQVDGETKHPADVVKQEEPEAHPAPTTPQAPVASVAQQASVAPQAPAMQPTTNKPGKTQNGITIYVPIEYYMEMYRMKVQTGKPIKDIALQAVIEYVDRHRND